MFTGLGFRGLPSLVLRVVLFCFLDSTGNFMLWASACTSPGPGTSVAFDLPKDPCQAAGRSRCSIFVA